jgi:hypothetical protein
MFVSFSFLSPLVNPGAFTSTMPARVSCIGLEVNLNLLFHLFLSTALSRDHIL